MYTFAFGTGLSYKLSKNHPHLTELKDFIYSFQFEFYAVYFELIYTVCCSELSASQDFSRTQVFNKLHISIHHCQKSPVIELSRIDRY